MEFNILRVKCAVWWATYLCLVNACSHSSTNCSLSFLSSLSDFRGNDGIFRRQLRCEHASSQGSWHLLTPVSHLSLLPKLHYYFIYCCRSCWQSGLHAQDSIFPTPTALLFSLPPKYVILVWSISLRLIMLCDHPVQHCLPARSKTSAFTLKHHSGDQEPLSFC